MKILLAHNYYIEAGGEDKALSYERDLLLAVGNSIFSFFVSNKVLHKKNELSLIKETLWSKESFNSLQTLIRRERPFIAHFHNTFPLLSPSVYDAARVENIPVIQTLHNYRLLCPNALFLRGGKVCTDCLDHGTPIFGALRGCYRNSRSASAVVALMLIFHRARRTWQTRVDRYIALTEFARQTFIRGGLPAEKIVVKPNFVSPDPGMGSGTGVYALFVGRLSPEKGLNVLLDAWEKHGLKVPLKIIGDGPDAARTEMVSQHNPHIEWLGRRDNSEVLEWAKQARVLVMPSIWYEGFPMTLVESYACGTPVIASDIGSLHELVDPGRTGLRFRPGDSADLAAQVERIFRDDAEWQTMRQGAREEYLSKYTAERNYTQLMDIYQQAISSK